MNKEVHYKLVYLREDGGQRCFIKAKFGFRDGP